MNYAKRRWEKEFLTVQCVHACVGAIFTLLPVKSVLINWL